MATNTLTDAKCKAAKPGAKPYKLFDGNGMYLHISVAGGKHWHLSYRKDGKPQTKTLGPYPILSLAEARIKRDLLRAQLLAGESIKAVKKQEAMTLSEVCTAFWEPRKDISADYKASATRAIERHILPKLGAMQIRDIGRAELMGVLGAMDAAGLHSYVRKTRMWLSNTWEWAVANVERTGAVENPCTLINPRKAFSKVRVESFASLELTQIPGFMKRLELDGIIQSAQACRLMALTAVRTNELRSMLWSELDGDLWRIPKDRMKKDLDLLVPLSRQALLILENMRARESGSIYVFPNARRLDRPMSENAVLYLIGRMGYGKEMTGHGWRRAMSTWANEAGFSPDAIERQLAHVPSDKVRGIYNRAEYLPERRRMLQSWADWLMP